MIKRKKRINLKKRILLSAGVFIIITLLIFKGGLANIYMMYSNRPSNDIHIDEASKVEEPKVGASKVEASEFDSSYVVAIDAGHGGNDPGTNLSLIHISEPTRRTPISYAVFCLKKKRTH